LLCTQSAVSKLLLNVAWYFTSSLLISMNSFLLSLQNLSKKILGCIKWHMQAAVQKPKSDDKQLQGVMSPRVHRAGEQGQVSQGQSVSQSVFVFMFLFLFGFCCLHFILVRNLQNNSQRNDATSFFCGRHRRCNP
jgi:hypothetical protein